MIMVKYEIKAYSLDEAKQKAAVMGLTVVRYVTQSWKNAGSPMNDKDFKTFAVDVMDKNRLTATSGVALAVAVDPGSKDTRERPYKFVNNVQEGRRTTKRVFEVRIKETDELVGEASTKGDAIDLAKAAMIKYKKSMYCPIVYRVAEEEKAVAFDLEYVPSVSAKEGTYVIFGNEKGF